MKKSIIRCSDHARLAQRTLVIVMAGGSGTRLGALTQWHAKPALPFGGHYRNIDFTLSNCLNSGLRRIAVLTQYKAHSLIQHLQRGWGFLSPEVDEFVEAWPAQQRAGNGWYAGTADALYQNIDLIESHGTERVLVLAGDHVYKMDYSGMLQAHAMQGADVTVGCVEVPIQDARAFGIMEVGTGSWIQRFDEKPSMPRALPGKPGFALASMGIYVFDRALLLDCLRADAANKSSRHDFGRDILPRLIEAGRALSYPLRDRHSGEPGYWRDVGTLDQYWQAHMDLLCDPPKLDLHDRSWPIRSHAIQAPPPRFVAGGSVRSAIVAEGCWVAGRLERSVVSSGCRIAHDAVIEDSVLLPDVEVGAGCRIRRAVVDSGCLIPDGVTIDGAVANLASPFDLSPGRVALVTAADVGLKCAPRRSVPATRDSPLPAFGITPDVQVSGGGRA